MCSFIINYPKLGKFLTIFIFFLTVRLGNTFQFVLLFDSVWIWGSLCCIDQFIGQTFSDCLDVTECGFTGSGAQQPDGLKMRQRKRSSYNRSKSVNRRLSLSLWSIFKIPMKISCKVERSLYVPVKLPFTVWDLDGILSGEDTEKPRNDSYLVDTTQRWDIDGLTTDSTSTTNTCRIFTWAWVDDGGNQDL